MIKSTVCKNNVYRPNLIAITIETKTNKNMD